MPRKLRSFAEALDRISRTHVPFHMDDYGKIRIAEPQNPHQTDVIPYEDDPGAAQCPLQAVAAVFGYRDERGHVRWDTVMRSYEDELHLTQLADSPSYRRGYPEDARLLKMACGLPRSVS